MSSATANHFAYSPLLLLSVPSLVNSIVFVQASDSNLILKRMVKFHKNDNDVVFVIAFVFVWPIKKLEIDFFTRHNGISVSSIVISIQLNTFFLLSCIRFIRFFPSNLMSHSFGIRFQLNSYFKKLKQKPYNVCVSPAHSFNYIFSWC